MPKTLAHKNAPLKGEKKVYKVSDYPYMTQEKWGEPKYYKSFLAAKQGVIKDLESIRDSWKQLNVQDSIDACNSLIVQVDEVLRVDGGILKGIIDPYSGIKFQVELICRRDVM